MVDVAAKPVTARRASAVATVRMRADVLASLLDAGGPKGDAMVTARLAGIGAAKRTSDLIPLCHPLPLDHVEVAVEPRRDDGSVIITATVATTARTGVEMEALTAASIAALTLYDMAKALQRDIVIERIELTHKSGGRSGTYARDQVAAGLLPTNQDAPDRSGSRAAHEAAVLTVSTRAAAGEREDLSGPIVVAALVERGFTVRPEADVVPDDEERIAATIARLCDSGYRLVVTTGGTGLTATDVTPAATRRVIDREVPGMAEQMRLAGLSSTPMASLSRGIVGTRGRTLVLNLPGSPAGAAESLAAVAPVLRHAIEQLGGGDH